jgi:hypothetical protein
LPADGRALPQTIRPAARHPGVLGRKAGWPRPDQRSARVSMGSCVLPDAAVSRPTATPRHRPEPHDLLHHRCAGTIGDFVCARPSDGIIPVVTQPSPVIHPAVVSRDVLAGWIEWEFPGRVVGPNPASVARPRATPAPVSHAATIIKSQYH